jgi:thymidylate synthase
MNRLPPGIPKLRINRWPSRIFNYRIEDFEVSDYAPLAHISAAITVRQTSTRQRVGQSIA